jgi:hypothetical protein
MLSGSIAVGQDLPPLPGPALEIPVDVDGDGLSSYADLHVFNEWLALGGSVDTALENAEPLERVLSLAKFFASSASALSDDSVMARLQGSSVPLAEGFGGVLAGGDLTGCCLSSSKAARAIGLSPDSPAMP